MNETKHTPTPFHIGHKKHEIWSKDGQMIAQCLTDDAPFFVKACNERANHLNLLRWALDKLDLANNIIDPYEDGEPYAGVLVDQITIAIEQAKE